MHENAEEGWYTDPFARHDARWMSAGEPTKLVRDGTVTSYDEPPDEPPTQDPMPIEPEATTEGADFRRADAAEQGDMGYDDSRATMGALDAIGQVGAPNMERLYEGEEY
ncbi:MAG TPA: hypothetical protein VMB82_13540 [Acidimicrobiales bacterium]|nr:hypothetical protein [Acidimicrobiales bacterium]